MTRCLLDTSTLSDVMRPSANRLAITADRLRAYLRSYGQFTFSEISCFEILRGLQKKSASTQLERFRTFCRHSELLPVTFEILDHAAVLWADGQKQGVTVDDSDLIIAATALAHGLPLVTANPKHFTWIAGLTVYNWRE